MKYFRRTVILLCCLRGLSLLFQIFYPVVSPHVWRQVDTLAVAARYAMDWKHGLWNILPRVLNSGNTDGIMPMEFPLLNILAAPAFYFFEGKIAFRIAHGELLIFEFMLLFFCWKVWRRIEIGGINAGILPLLSLVISFAQPFLGKFIPDILAYLFILLGLGLWWQERRFFLAVACATIGILIKPTAAILFALVLLHPSFPAFSIVSWMMAAVSLSAGVFYYTWGMAQLDRLREITGLFKVRMQSPMENLLSVLRDGPLEFLSVFDYHLWFPFGAVLVLLSTFFGYRIPWKVYGVIALQIGAIFLIDGSHAYQHTYYFAPVSFACALALVHFILVQKRQFLVWIAGVLCIIHVGEVAVADLKGFLKPEESFMTQVSACETLRLRQQNLPWNKRYVFAATDIMYPRLGLCFGERVGNPSAEYGFYFANETPPLGCKTLDREKDIAIYQCSKSNGP